MELMLFPTPRTTTTILPDATLRLLNRDQSVTEQLELSPMRLLRLLNWVSPALPIGSFAYSHGRNGPLKMGMSEMLKR